MPALPTHHFDLGRDRQPREYAIAPTRSFLEVNQRRERADRRRDAFTRVQGRTTNLLPPTTV